MYIKRDYDGIRNSTFGGQEECKLIIFNIIFNFISLTQICYIVYVLKIHKKRLRISSTTYLCTAVHANRIVCPLAPLQQHYEFHC